MSKRLLTTIRTNYMNRKEFEELVPFLYDEAIEHPFKSDETTAVFRHKANRKWFAVVMTISKNKLGIPSDGTIDIVNLKCAQEILDSLWQEKGIFPAYHMSKGHWLSVALDGSVDSDTIKWLLEISYDLTRTKIPRKKTK